MRSEKLSKSRTVCSPLLLWWVVLIYLQIMMMQLIIMPNSQRHHKSWLGVDFHYFEKAVPKSAA